MSFEDIEHAPVLLGPVLDALKPRPGGLYLDATVGLGGHAEALLRGCFPDGRLVGLDRDGQALERARQRLAEHAGRVSLLHMNYSRLAEVSESAEGFDGVLADLGVSSPQLLDPSRGFSLAREGPLDMRMDPTEGETAAEFLQRVPPKELEELLREAGEERFARRLVGVLKEGAAVWRTTRDLAEGVARVLPRRGKSHPATRVFLALRMAVNRELENLKVFLEKVPDVLKPGGRLAVITFHSTEDRVVKRFFREIWKPAGRMGAVTKSPIAPVWEERRKNPRSRSAKLRVFEKPI